MNLSVSVAEPACSKPKFSVEALCPLCGETKNFEAPDDHHSCRTELNALTCPLTIGYPRERAIADAIFSLYSREEVKTLALHEAAPSGTGFSKWLWDNAANLTFTGYFPDKPFGQIVGVLRNEDLERQSFQDETFDIVVHLDVMEHLFAPFVALQEIYRTLKPGGRCFFTAPTYPDREKSEQVAFIQPDGAVRTIGEPEYHGNPQDGQGGSIVTWRYGHDLPRLIAAMTDFDVEVRRWLSKRRAVMGPMTEVYILTKPL